MKRCVLLTDHAWSQPRTSNSYAQRLYCHKDGPHYKGTRHLPKSRSSEAKVDSLVYSEEQGQDLLPNVGHGHKRNL